MARKYVCTRSTSKPILYSGNSSTNSANPLRPLFSSTPRSISLANPSSPTPAAPPYPLRAHPAYPSAPARPKGLHRRLFHRKTSGIPLKFVLELLAIRHFIQRKHAPQKPVPLRLNHRPNPRHFRHVNPYSDDHPLTCAAAFDSRPAPDFCLGPIAIILV